jgi:hypothetical protein
MIFNFFDNCLSIEGQYLDNRIYSIIIGGIICYLALLVIVKNIIYYKHISENIYWLLMILIFFDLTIFMNNNREFIEKKIKEFNEYILKINDKKSFIKKEAIEIKTELKQTLIDDEEYTTSVIV